MYTKLLLLTSLSIFHKYSADELPVVISRGAFIRGISGVTVYNDVELLHHVISGIMLKEVEYSLKFSFKWLILV